MRALLLGSILASSALVTGASWAQLQEGTASDAVRVTVSINQDGSRTEYQFDPANKKATATTSSPEGKPLGRIHYELDAAGQFAAGQVLDGSGRFRFKTLYKYDRNGRLVEETQLTREGSVIHRLVYDYGPDGRQTGYSVYDGAANLLGQTKPVSSPPEKKRKK